MKYEAIVVGASLGGFELLKKLIITLPANFAVPIIVVLHVGAHSDSYWVSVLNKLCSLTVKEADEKEKIEKGKVYTAPPNYHLLIEDDHTFSLSNDERVNFARPSIDVLFESAALTLKHKLIGVILSGANGDGSLGLKKIKEYGGLAIVQDPETAESPVMPIAAIKATSVDYILPIEQITEILLKINE